MVCSISKFHTKLSPIYLLVINLPLPIPYQPLHLNIFVFWSKTCIIKIIVVFDWGFQCYQLSLCCIIFPINLSSLFRIKSDAIYTLLFLLGLSQYVPTDSCLEPVPIIPFLFAAIGFVKPIAATAYWHWYCFVFTQFYSHHEQQICIGRLQLDIQFYVQLWPVLCVQQ